jgi:hypothetical protein
MYMCICAIASVCCQASEGSACSLSCPGGGVISSIDFASYGLPSGTCQQFSYEYVSASNTPCHAEDSYIVVSKECFLQQSCAVEVNYEIFTFSDTAASARCIANNAYLSNRLYVQATCLHGKGTQKLCYTLLSI